MRTIFHGGCATDNMSTSWEMKFLGVRMLGLSLSRRGQARQGPGPPRGRAEGRAARARDHGSAVV